MRATYCREINAMQHLNRLNIENFIPMSRQIYVERGKKEVKLTPVVHNLIFVNTTPSRIRAIKMEIPYLQYITCILDGQRKPIIIPENQMRKFIAITENKEKNLIYLCPEEIHLLKGTKVRIHGGLLDGQNGIFVKLDDNKNKRIVFMFKEVIAVAVPTDDVDFIEII